MQKQKWSTQMLIRIALLSAISLILYYCEINIPPFPAFLKMDLGDIPAIIAAFVLGPLPAIAVEFFKNVLHLLLRSSTGGIGELSNFFVGVCFVVPMGVAVRNEFNKKNVVLGAVSGTVLMVAAACIYNYFVALPVYLGVSGKEAFHMVMTVMVPFNIIKGVILAVIGYAVFVGLRPVLRQLKIG